MNPIEKRQKRPSILRFKGGQLEGLV